jgi:hypothetical protein
VSRVTVAAVGRSQKWHALELQVTAAADAVTLHVRRSSRRQAKSDLLITLSPMGARNLMRALQGGADEADRLAYRHAKDSADSLDAAVQAVAAALVKTDIP